MGGLWEFLTRWFGWFWSGIHAAVSAFGDILGQFFTSITTYLSTILQPLLDFLGGLGYLLQTLLDIIVLTIQIFLLLLQVALATVGGVMRTFVSLAAWDPSTLAPERNPYDAGTQLILSWWDQLGGGVVPLVLSWVVWVLFVRAVFRLWRGA